jgi:hypothetical protein
MTGKILVTFAAVEAPTALVTNSWALIEASLAREVLTRAAGERMGVWQLLSALIPSTATVRMNSVWLDAMPASRL